MACHANFAYFYAVNYLAHILLSGNDMQRQLGGFIADNVKGSRLDSFPQRIREGILLHRRVDVFTDEHALVREARVLLRPYFGRYTGIFLDIFLDYFLAREWRHFSKLSLRAFAYRFYWGMVRHRRWLPLSVKGFLWHFIGSNRLCKYATLDGVQRALWIMGNYSSLPQMSGEAIQVLQKHEKELEKIFVTFFPVVQEFASSLLVQNSEENGLIVPRNVEVEQDENENGERPQRRAAVADEG